VAEAPPVKEYRSDEVTVSFDARRCLHFAECVRGLPEVFDVHKRPWIQPDQADSERVAAAVRRCPSGALHYVLADGPAEIGERPTRVGFVDDGPMTLRGELVIETPAGELSETRAALCRCGRTGNAPFCDHACQPE
jgi:uncharacterized Fe-S cluster protein YjdI